MYEKNIGGVRASDRISPSLRYSDRTRKLLYIAKTLPNRVSPLKLLVQNVNSIGSQNYAQISPTLSDSLLTGIETGQTNFLNKHDTRTMQRVLSLAYFGKLNIHETRPKRVSETDFEFFLKNSKSVSSHLRSFTKRARHESIRLSESQPRGLRFQLCKK